MQQSIESHIAELEIGRGNCPIHFTSPVLVVVVVGGDPCGLYYYLQNGHNGWLAHGWSGGALCILRCNARRPLASTTINYNIYTIASKWMAGIELLPVSGLTRVQKAAEVGGGWRSSRRRMMMMIVVQISRCAHCKQRFNTIFPFTIHRA